jgi:hypothetical protein
VDSAANGNPLAAYANGNGNPGTHGHRHAGDANTGRHSYRDARRYARADRLARANRDSHWYDDGYS